MRTTTAPTIRLKNYTPPAYTVSHVDLTFDLKPEATRVRSVLTVHRTKDTPAGAPLFLDGDELTLETVSVNQNAVASDGLDLKSDRLILKNPPKGRKFEVEIETLLAPVSNTKLMGLYQTKGVYCTQCEAEGFRRITYFPDRPDVLATYTVRVEADKKDCPVLLSNGNPQSSGKLEDGRHFAVWHDPHPKPSYLFALVAGQLDVLPDTFTTASGRHVDLNIYVEPGRAPMARYAMDALIRSMKWDEENYGCEYDLEVFNIVAVSDFNMGAMENKGLNVFNDKYVLANDDLATDTDKMHIEAIIAHEYFHNWTGNRITCRDWFQLCLKEGLTVYRDQEFSADMRSHAVQRIQQVRTLKSAQFSEDAGPLAHNVRPVAYKEINNFYTATVYQKGAELVRMLATLVGPKGYRKATDLYFKRHDGEAAVVEDFLRCFEDANGVDLTQFKRWYEQAGTPAVTVKEKFDRRAKTYELHFSQAVPPTPGQKTKRTVPIPVRFALLGSDGKKLNLTTKSKTVRGDVILLEKAETKVRFEKVERKPIPSLLRGFSSPVQLLHRESDRARAFRARHDDDLFNRWQALNAYCLKELKALAKPNSSKADVSELVSILVETAFDDALEPAWRAQALTLPSEQDIAREIARSVDPEAVSKARNHLTKKLGASLGAIGVQKLEELKAATEQADDLQAAGLRALKNTLLTILASSGNREAVSFAKEQFGGASNMTDRLAALAVLVHHQRDRKLSQNALDQFYETYREEPLVIDKWFMLQAQTAGSSGLTAVKKLAKHPDFTLENPNRARSLLYPFAAANLTGFHRADGKAYAFFISKIAEIDRINPQLAARMLTAMNTWRMFERGRSKLAKDALKDLAKRDGLSRDVQEIVDRSLL